MSELVKELQNQLAQVKQLCAMKEDKIRELKWFSDENRFNLSRIIRVNCVVINQNQIINL